MTARVDLDAIERAGWLHPCGSCDLGVAVGCSCPDGDPRIVISQLVTEVEDLRKLATEAGELCNLKWLQLRDRFGGYVGATPLRESSAGAIERAAHDLRSLLEAHGFRFDIEAYRASIRQTPASPQPTRKETP